jgi:hypothetical protein
MTKTNIPYFSLRLLTVFSYFLPFVFYLSTCSSDPTVKDAFNKEDAIQNEKNEQQIKLNSINSFISAIDTTTVNKSEALTELAEKINKEFYSTDNVNNLNESFENIIYFPTNYSLSAIGTILGYKNLLGKILISISIFLSLISLFLWVLIDKYKIAFYLLSLNILTTTAFIIDCYVSNVSVLVGAWTLLFLLTMQLLTEIQTRKKANP